MISPAHASKTAACISYLLISQQEPSPDLVLFMDKLEFILEKEGVWFVRENRESLCIDVQHNGKKLANSEGKAQDQKWLNDNGFISGQDI